MKTKKWFSNANGNLKKCFVIMLLTRVNSINLTKNNLLSSDNT